MFKIHDIKVVSDVEELLKEVRNSLNRRSTGKRVAFIGEWQLRDYYLVIIICSNFRIIEALDVCCI